MAASASMAHPLCGGFVPWVDNASHGNDGILYESINGRQKELASSGGV